MAMWRNPKNSIHASFAAQGEECEVGTQQLGFVGPLADI